jgi:hypothetical protein
VNQTLTLAAVTALAGHIAAHPHLDQLRVYHIRPAIERSRMFARVEISLFAKGDDALTELATWAATLTNPITNARTVEGAHGSLGHMEGWVDGELADGTAVRIGASIPAGVVPVQPGQHPLTLPTLASVTVT